MTDKVLSLILKGLRNLTKLVITNGKFGPLSSLVLHDLIPGIKELWINNIQISMNKKVATDILESIIANGPTI